MTYPDRDPRPADRPVNRPTEYIPPTEAAYPSREEVVERTDGRVRTVRVVCAVIDLLCWLFAIVLAIHIFLVIGGANPANGFAQLIDSWSAAVSLGLRDLFTPADPGVRTLFNDGLAALLWLVIGAVLTNIISRIALPAGERRTWYRRTVR
ncbi:hypothetical protein F4560_004578 [Saccharothrix ecbatanensis]|jgi:hypothetical protein|uniref:Uncharacterized protein n=1 Tax=Saccharothrix ecbatanensis TaxID=1105145 RepID=A0A7W9HM76_9PSEU|nr:hypothetical protein [Saccharothrix ecbatanensis]MBB5804810.1 hypothetical protein [Saccharothrix ecbatanensis]